MNLKLLLTALLLVNLSYDAWAGTSMTELSKKTNIIDADESMKSEAKKAEEGLKRVASSAAVFFLWNLGELKRSVVNNDLSLLDHSLTELEDRIKKYNEPDGILTYDDRFALKLAIKNNNMEQAAAIVNRLWDRRASSSVNVPVGASVQNYSTTITRMRP